MILIDSSAVKLGELGHVQKQSVYLLGWDTGHATRATPWWQHHMRAPVGRYNVGHGPTTYRVYLSGLILEVRLLADSCRF